MTAADNQERASTTRTRERKSVSAVGFEPTSANTVELESTPLDRSGTLTFMKIALPTKTTSLFQLFRTSPPSMRSVQHVPGSSCARRHGKWPPTSDSSDRTRISEFKVVPVLQLCSTHTLPMEATASAGHTDQRHDTAETRAICIGVYFEQRLR